MDTPTCIQAGANASALRVPVQCATCTGGRQRKSPTGGAANGPPLYTPNPLARTPDISPVSVGGCGPCASVIADIDGTKTISRALIKTLELNLGILTFWYSSNGHPCA